MPLIPVHNPNTDILNKIYCKNYHKHQFRARKLRKDFQHLILKIIIKKFEDIHLTTEIFLNYHKSGYVLDW